MTQGIQTNNVLVCCASCVQIVTVGHPISAVHLKRVRDLLRLHVSDIERRRFIGICRVVESEIVSVHQCPLPL